MNLWTFFSAFVTIYIRKKVPKQHTPRAIVSSDASPTTSKLSKIFLQQGRQSLIATIRLCHFPKSLFTEYRLWYFGWHPDSTMSESRLTIKFCFFPGNDDSLPICWNKEGLNRIRNWAFSRLQWAWKNNRAMMKTENLHDRSACEHKHRYSNGALPDPYLDCTLSPTVCDQAANQLVCLCET